MAKSIFIKGSIERSKHHSETNTRGADVNGPLLNDG